jgi:hypothetical protein
MPSSHQILAGLTAIAHGALPVAVGWHLVLLAAMVAVLIGVRPSKRLTGVFLAMPLLSVSVSAFVSGNPFNGAACLGLSVILLLVALRFEGDSIELDVGWSSTVGWAMIAFASLYPHFLDDRPAVIYLVGAPMGVVPCPTLSLVVGASILFLGIEGRAWSLVVAAAGLVYGVVGVVRLGVRLDLVLIAGSAALVAVVLRRIPDVRSASRRGLDRAKAVHAP